MEVRKREITDRVSGWNRTREDLKRIPCDCSMRVRYRDRGLNFLVKGSLGSSSCLLYFEAAVRVVAAMGGQAILDLFGRTVGV